MIYPYLRISPAITRPIIQIIIKSEGKFAIYPALIDSGADFCIFDIELANNLGIKLEDKKANFRGIGKDEVEGLWGEIEIKIEEVTYKTEAIFAPISEFGHGILGQKGFFDHFDVRLSYKNQTIEIKPS